MICNLPFTGVVFAGDLKRDPDLITSVRYLAKDKKNPTAKWVKGLLTQKGLIKGGEMDPDSALAQVIFVVTQVTAENSRPSGSFFTQVDHLFLANSFSKQVINSLVLSIGVYSNSTAPFYSVPE